MTLWTPVTFDVSGNRFNVRCSAVSFEFDQEFFERPEFSNDKLNAAKNIDGSKPSQVSLYGGQVGNFLVGCGANTTTRPYAPDDANVASLHRRWDIRRYQLTGDVTPDPKALALQQFFVTGKTALTRLAARAARIQGDISYQALITAEGDAFTSITSTPLSMFGPAVGNIGTMSAASSGSSGFVTPLALYYTVGQKLLLEAGSAREEVVTITSVNLGASSVGISGTLAHNHANGAPIQLWEGNLLVTAFKADVARQFIINGISTVRKTWTATVESRADQAAEA